MLVCLVRQRLVKQRPADRHYLPGPMLFELGLALPELSALQNRARTWLAALAKHRPSVAFLFFRSGDDFVCAERAGNSDLKALTIMPERGGRSPPRQAGQRCYWDYRDQRPERSRAAT
jgi:DNA-binding IclR family transcriptional regulator